MPHKNCRSEAGSVIAETAVSVGIFLLLLLTTVDAVFYMYSIAATQYSINEAARKLILLPSTNSAIKSEIVSTAAKYGIILQSSNITICDNDHPTCTAASELPASSSAQPMLIKASYENARSLRLFGITSVNVEAYVFNEPY